MTTAQSIESLLGCDFTKVEGTIIEIAAILAAEMASRPARSDEVEVATALAGLLTSWVGVQPA